MFNLEINEQNNSVDFLINNDKIFELTFENVDSNVVVGNSALFSIKDITAEICDKTDYTEIIITNENENSYNLSVILSGADKYNFIKNKIEIISQYSSAIIFIFNGELQLQDNILQIISNKKETILQIKAFISPITISTESVNILSNPVQIMTAATLSVYNVVVDNPKPDFAITLYDDLSLSIPRPLYTNIEIISGVPNVPTYTTTDTTGFYYYYLKGESRPNHTIYIKITCNNSTITGTTYFDKLNITTINSILQTTMSIPLTWASTYWYGSFNANDFENETMLLFTVPINSTITTALPLNWAVATPGSDETPIVNIFSERKIPSH